MSLLLLSLSFLLSFSLSFSLSFLLSFSLSFSLSLLLVSLSFLWSLLLSCCRCCCRCCGRVVVVVVVWSFVRDSDPSFQVVLLLSSAQRLRVKLQLPLCMINTKTAYVSLFLLAIIHGA